MHFGLISVDPIEPLHIRLLFPISVLALITFITSIVASIRQILLRRHGRYTAMRSVHFFLSFRFSLLCLLAIMITITCYYFTVTVDQIIRLSAGPGEHPIVRQAAHDQFLRYLYFSLPALALGVLSQFLLKYSSK